MIVVTKRSLVRCAAVLLATGLAHAAPPQTVYRCGPEGRVYSQTPCADGQVVGTDDSRSAAQQKAAREVAERESRAAQQLADERRRREAAARSQTAAGIKPEPADTAASESKRKTRSKAGAQTPPDNMSPPMRVPTPLAKPG